MSILPPPPNLSQALKDPRAIREKIVQQSMRNAIHSWLQETGFPHNLSKQILLSPTAKDFHNIFEHLISLIDQDFVFNKSTPKTFEDDIIPLLRAHSYPFVDSIDKKYLAAPASMHSWPPLVAALHWLTELGKVLLKIFCSLCWLTSTLGKNGILQQQRTYITACGARTRSI